MRDIVVNPPVDVPAPASTPAQDLRAWADERAASTKTVAEEYAQPRFSNGMGEVERTVTFKTHDEMQAYLEKLPRFSQD